MAVDGRWTGIGEKGDREVGEGGETVGVGGGFGGRDGGLWQKISLQVFTKFCVDYTEKVRRAELLLFCI